MPVQNSSTLLRLAQSALTGGDPRQAAGFCRQILAGDARNADARYLLGLTHALTGEPDAAIEQWQQVLRIRPRDFPTLVNLGVALAQRGNHRDAIPQLRKALDIDSSQPTVHYNLGTSLLATGQVADAIASFRAAIARDPGFAEARNNLGVAYRKADRLADARNEFAAAVATNPDYADAHSNLGSALQTEGELEAAIVSFTRALKLDEHATDAALGLAQVLEQLGRTTEAMEVLARAAAANPDTVDIHYALGVARHRAGQLESAMSCYERVLSLRPDAPQAWRDQGRALESLQRLTEALESFRKSISLEPGDVGAVAGALSCAVRTCEWTTAVQSLQKLRTVPSGLEAIHPFLALSICDDPAEQLRIATSYGQNAAPGLVIAPLRPNAPDTRIRVAYVSSDLRDHAVAYVIAGVLERHDRDLFEIHAISLQPEAHASEIGQRLRRAVEHFHDVSARRDAEVAQLLRELRIDIAVDLNGYTVGARPAIFAYRAAPVQACHVGYAGTLGVPYMDYLLADRVTIRPGEERGYSEQVVRLPHCYLPNDDRREMGRTPARAHAGLPDTGLVFCAFTNAYKINAPVFDVWMRLLQAVEGSVLWLRGMGVESKSNLQREAQQRGVAPERLVFAPHVASVAEHLGRHVLADLFLDTAPYNAHSTAMDALWAGVPVLTCAGRTFAARVAASALTAVGVPELITHSLAEYERKALDLAQNPSTLQALRTRLVASRATAPLFDTPRFCRNLEAAYRGMHERAMSGESPRGFDVAD